jgi:hypothetical protein
MSPRSAGGKGTARFPPSILRVSKCVRLVDTTHTEGDSKLVCTPDVLEDADDSWFRFDVPDELSVSNGVSARS